MPLSDDAKWHWQEGNKFAVQGMKTLLLLNGGAAIALLTFVGHLPKGTADLNKVRAALFLFGFGALTNGAAFALAYGTQLRYGNSERAAAVRWHNATYFAIGSSAVCFLWGLWFAIRTF